MRLYFTANSYLFILYFLCWGGYEDGAPIITSCIFLPIGIIINYIMYLGNISDEILEKWKNGDSLEYNNEEYYYIGTDIDDILICSNINSMSGKKRLSLSKFSKIKNLSLKKRLEKDYIEYI